ncbi:MULTISPECIES: hypothetical protein [unclassified Streptomyces]|uniref:hypothetical protein n=1 Tax=unclassified Streptomyces TaxID=2593676 RepID=UPI00224E14B2|nr:MULTISPECIES: hypothetical protein [unclassified Streptomyces]MCX4406470.1 hypothetical protein [Streptomyces sp. NBC_01764]MCX5189006.1 hypothetical protein [Streptomyces sp. NBC_00268]
MAHCTYPNRERALRKYHRRDAAGPTPLQRRRAAQAQEDQREPYPVDEYRISTR